MIGLGRSFTRLALLTSFGYVSHVELDEDPVRDVYVKDVSYVDNLEDAELFLANTWLMMESDLFEYIKRSGSTYLDVLEVRDGEVQDTDRVFGEKD